MRMILERLEEVRDTVYDTCPWQSRIDIDHAAHVDDDEQRHHREQTHRHVGDVHLLGEREDHERKQEQVVLNIARKDEHQCYRQQHEERQDPEVLYPVTCDLESHCRRQQDDQRRQYYGEIERGCRCPRIHPAGEPVHRCLEIAVEDDGCHQDQHGHRRPSDTFERVSEHTLEWKKKLEIFFDI